MNRQETRDSKHKPKKTMPETTDTKQPTRDKCMRRQDRLADKIQQ